MNALTKNEKKALTKKYRNNIAGKLQDIKASGIPFFVLIEGWGGSGKPVILNELIKSIDPRFYSVYVEEEYEDHGDYPYLYRYYHALPQNGTFRFLNGGYMNSTLRECFDGKLSSEEYEDRIRCINNFERTLVNNGYVVVKIFLDITKKEQKKRFDTLSSDLASAWRVKHFDLFQNANYKAWKKGFEAFMNDTNEYSAWHTIDANDLFDCRYEAFKLLSDAVDSALANGKYNGAPYEEEFTLLPAVKLADVDLSPTISDEEYDKQLKKLEKKITKLSYQIYKNKIPFILGFEGWDAAGKGGAIKRIAYPLDPRDFEVIPVASPTPPEKNRHFLWRFYEHLPKKGKFHIFDRTWYGRVMVERLEGFCTENDWKRAYNEINEFEKDLSDWGAVILKFWIQIDKDTQLKRFNDRQNTPEKQWKITDEDWRNRDKWDDYEIAVNEMIEKTSTEYAPWHIIESVDKEYARIKVMRIVVEAMEKALEEKNNRQD